MKRKILSLICLMLPVCLLFSSCKIAGGGEKSVYPPSDGEKVVMIDPGHGFLDIGCDTELLDGNEAQVNLAMALLLKEALEERGCRVVLTHDGETFPSAEDIMSAAKEADIEFKEESFEDNEIFSPYERAVYSQVYNEETQIDLFISLHVNSVENAPEVSRYEIDYYEGNTYAAALAELCRSIADGLDNETKIYADEYDMAFIVTKFTPFPSVLLEMGYATNENDAKNLNSPQWRREFVNTLAENIDLWISTFEK